MPIIMIIIKCLFHKYIQNKNIFINSQLPTVYIFINNVMDTILTVLLFTLSN